MTKLTLPSLVALEADAKRMWAAGVAGVSKQDVEDIWQDAVVSFLEGETTTAKQLERFVKNAARKRAREDMRFDSL